MTTSCSAKAVRSSEMAGIEDHEIMSKHAKPRKRPLAGKKALAYWDCYINGMSESEIADQFHVSRQVVSAMLKTLNAKECPYSSCCFTCPQADCIIEDEYATLVNLNETDCEEYEILHRKQKRRNKTRRSKQQKGTPT